MDHPALSAMRGLLGLLVDGAPAEDFARPAAEARAAGLAPDEQAAVDEATRMALDIRRTLEAHRRRERELAALFDSAGDLAALRDLDAVLRAIVHRARTLLGTDTAYLTMNDPVAGDTFMRVTDGSVSAKFQQLRLGMGEGLGGLVAQTALPYASRDYRTDTRFNHTRTIDDAVGEEGLRGILGVPIRVGTRVIGVLYAADRRPRDFDPDAVTLLSSLADLAAVAIDNARLLEETRATLTELNAANAELNAANEELNAANETVRARSEEMRRAAAIHDRLTGLVLRGGDATDVAREIVALLGGGLVVHDADGTEVARVAAEPFVPAPDGVAASRASGRAVPVDGTWVYAVLAGAEPLGTMALLGRPELTDGDRRLFERAGIVTALLLLLRRSVAEAEDRVRGDLLGDLLTGGNADSLTLRARKLGVVFTRAHAVLVLQCDASKRERLLTEASRRARALGGLAGTHNGNVVLLAPTDAPGALAQSLSGELRDALGGVPVTIGASASGPGLGRLPAAFEEALRCARALHTLGRSGEGADPPSLGFLGVLLGDRADVEGYVRGVLGPVIDYDRRRGTELVRTLDAYYRSGASLTEARQALHVHVNTVVQRLDRVRRLLGDDWNSPSRALELQLALRLHWLSR
ncbi:helix-turn-helix domain-containing protein [Actinomadura rupiterrae]|uniref:helix-turn-helix domain-containing protein n=1 Tax=Actinomadura rupiterrae TaxID=559627 RepID=UPI0020A3B5EC|nr:GAF domain-containing protein [Actinomadura rupiterrae]MCP2340615.1 GAF domain-containing protein [Actinomadura rupiterrae]